MVKLSEKQKYASHEFGKRYRAKLTPRQKRSMQLYQHRWWKDHYAANSKQILKDKRRKYYEQTPAQRERRLRQMRYNYYANKRSV